MPGGQAVALAVRQWNFTNPPSEGGTTPSRRVLTRLACFSVPIWSHNNPWPSNMWLTMDPRSRARVKMFCTIPSLNGTCSPEVGFLHQTVTMLSGSASSDTGEQWSASSDTGEQWLASSDTGEQPSQLSSLDIDARVVRVSKMTSNSSDVLANPRLLLSQ